MEIAEDGIRVQLDVLELDAVRGVVQKDLNLDFTENKGEAGKRIRLAV